MPERHFEAATLSVEARQLYLAILHGAPVLDHQDNPKLAELLAFGLVVAHPGGPDHSFIALSPQQVAGRRRDRLFSQIATAMTAAAGLPEHLQDLAIAYQERNPAADPRRGAVEYIQSVGAINARISELVADCTTELLTAQPDGPRPAETLAMALPRDLDAVRRGVAMRTLYRTSVRSDAATSAWTAEMAAEGAHVRTLDEPFMRAIILDRRAAVLQDYTPWTGPGGEPRRALIVLDEGLVQYVAGVFDRDWGRASVWTGQAVREDAQLNDLQRSIMQHLVAGQGQAQVALALGLSERTISTHLAEMRRAFGYASTVQMAYEFGRRERTAH